MTLSNQHMRFDPQLRARPVELKEAIGRFTRYLIAQEDRLGLRSRARKDEDLRKVTIADEAGV